MCIENTGLGRYLLIFTNYLNNQFNNNDNSYDYNKKNDEKKDCLIDMEPLAHSMEMGTQTEDTEINWEVICDNS
jgi:hypothetical protein